VIEQSGEVGLQVGGGPVRHWSFGYAREEPAHARELRYSTGAAPSCRLSPSNQPRCSAFHPSFIAAHDGLCRKLTYPAT
jgi:hypothetical protein